MPIFMYVCMCVGRLVGMHVMSSCVLQIGYASVEAFFGNFSVSYVLFPTLSGREFLLLCDNPPLSSILAKRKLSQ